MSEKSPENRFYLLRVRSCDVITLSCRREYSNFGPWQVSRKNEERKARGLEVSEADSGLCDQSSNPLGENKENKQKEAIF